MMEWEAHAIMATIALHEFYDCARLRSLAEVQLGCDFRHIYLNLTVIRLFYLIFGLMGTCGFPVPFTEVCNRSNQNSDGEWK